MADYCEVSGVRLDLRRDPEEAALDAFYDFLGERMLQACADDVVSTYRFQMKGPLFIPCRRDEAS